MPHAIAMRRVAPFAGDRLAQSQNTPDLTSVPGPGHNSTALPRLPGSGLPFDVVPPARIYRPARSATTSGPGRREWVIEFERTVGPGIEPLIGWTTGEDPFATISLRFPTLSSALDFAERQGWSYRLEDPAPRKPRPKLRRDKPYRDRLDFSALGCCAALSPARATAEV